MVLCLQGWGLVWVSAGGSDPERLDLEREMERAKGKEGRCWVVEPLKHLQERAGLCAELREHAEHVGPWQWVAVAYLEVH